MHYRRLGRTGIKVSEIALGAWVTFGNQLQQKSASDLIHAAYDQGVNFFDNADVYEMGKAEEMMGKAIKDLPRDGLVLSSKVFWPTLTGVNGRGLSRKHMTESLHLSLRRFGLDYLDLYYCHRYDPDTPVEEVVFTMDSFIRQGKVMYWGTSEWEAAQVMQAIGIAHENHLIPPVVEQPKYNLLWRKRLEVELAQVVKEYGIGLTTFSPLSNGVLSGKYNDGVPEGSRATLKDYQSIRDRITTDVIGKARQLTAIAQELGITSAQLAIAWCLRRKDISAVITGATRVEQLDENLEAANFVDKLTEDVLNRLDAIFEDA